MILLLLHVPSRLRRPFDLSFISCRSCENTKPALVIESAIATLDMVSMKTKSYYTLHARPPYLL